VSDQIIPIALIEAKAEAAFARGDGRDDHGFNWHAPAIEHYQAAWDRCAAEANDQSTDASEMVGQLAEASPP
jgi:hypothetical protein